MTAQEYRAALARLGINQTEAAKLLQISDRTSRNYARHGLSGLKGKLILDHLKALRKLRETKGRL